MSQLKSRQVEDRPRAAAMAMRVSPDGQSLSHPCYSDHVSPMPAHWSQRANLQPHWTGQDTVLDHRWLTARELSTSLEKLKSWQCQEGHVHGPLLPTHCTRMPTVGAGVLIPSPLLGPSAEMPTLAYLPR